MKIKRILLVDDDHVSNFISKKAIEKANFADEIIVKNNGDDALVYLNKECPSLNQYPDLILLDLKMPGIDGFEFLEAFEMASKKIKHPIEVVILTSSRNPEDFMRLRKIGKYYVMNKPLTESILEDIYHRYFRNREILKRNS